MKIMLKLEFLTKKNGKIFSNERGKLDSKSSILIEIFLIFLDSFPQRKVPELADINSLILG